MKKVHVFTSAALNYIPKVRMLFRSLRKYHPEWMLHLALADELPPEIDLSSEPFDEVVSLDLLNIPSWQGWAFCHTIVELATAIKPFMLARLLKLPDAAKVIYLDPDMVVFSRLDDILDALDEANLVLTPHLTNPEKTLSAVLDNEICSLKHGVYNLGFLGVAATEVGHEFAKWWSQRLYYFCRVDIPNGLFTDQRWIDLVPAFFSGVAIICSSRHNVATWNLTTRELSIDVSGGYWVDGEPLGFYHFTGFDSGAHHTMATKNAGGNASVQKLIDWYSDKITHLSNDPLTKQSWAFSTFSDGTIINKAQRIIYRERIDLQRTFSNPFDASGYLSWWNTQGLVEYPDVFNPDTQDMALAKLSSVLTPGFSDSSNVKWEKAYPIIKEAMTHPSTGIKLLKRSWEILRIEGVRGFKSRLNRYYERNK